MKRFMRTIVFATILALLAGVTYEVSVATQRTVRGVPTKAAGIRYLRGTIRLTTRTTDTAYFAYNTNESSVACDTMLFTLYTYTARMQTDSVVSINVRHQTSTDNVTWTSPVTVGTDSTTWLTSTVFPTFTAQSSRVFGTAVYGAWAPYQRLMVWGRLGNKVGGTIRFDIKEP